MFASLKVSTLVALFKDEVSAQAIFALIFEKTCRDLNESNTKVLDELFELLKGFDANDDSQQKILLEIVVLVVSELSRDKRIRAHCDRFREILFEIVKKASAQKNNRNWLISTTLPAFVVIVKTYIAENKANATTDAASDTQTLQLIKLFVMNSVRKSSKLFNCIFSSNDVI